MTERLKPLSLLGIGSVPFKEEGNSCREIFESWDLPFWPQYPARSLRENFLFQFLSPFPGLAVTGQTASFDEARFLRNLKAYRESIDEAFSKKRFFSFEPPSDWALGFSEMKAFLDRGEFREKPAIKLQVTGPGTVWNSFFQDRVKSSSREIQKELVQTLSLAGLAQIERILSYGRRPLILIDEPLPTKGLWGLGEMAGAFRDSGAWVGLHVCSSAAWEGFESLAIHLFHFDLSAHPRFSPQNRLFLQNFLKQKKWVAWGIVPTAPGGGFKPGDFSGIFLDRLRELAGEGLSVEEILKQALIAPACGMGTLTWAQAEAVRKSLQMTSAGLAALCI